MDNTSNCESSEIDTSRTSRHTADDIDSSTSPSLVNPTLAALIKHILKGSDESKAKDLRDAVESNIDHLDDECISLLLKETQSSPDKSQSSILPLSTIVDLDRLFHILFDPARELTDDAARFFFFNIAHFNFDDEIKEKRALWSIALRFELQGSSKLSLSTLTECFYALKAFNYSTALEDLLYELSKKVAEAHSAEPYIVFSQEQYCKVSVQVVWSLLLKLRF